MGTKGARTCKVTAREEGGRYRAECATHKCRAFSTVRGNRDALELFVCDKGSPRWFVVDHPTELAAPLPDWVDLTGLAWRMRSHLLEVRDGNERLGELRAWEWVGDGQTAPVWLTGVSGGASQESGLAWWAVVTSRSAEILRVSVPVDGRA